MTTQEKYIQQLRQILTKNKHLVSQIEFTSGNYDDNGKLIRRPIPTITTQLCEIGLYEQTVYLTFVIESPNTDQKIIEILKPFSNFKIYGFKDFLTIFYPTLNFNYKTFEKNIKKEKYFQINFNFNSQIIIPSLLYKKYLIISKILKNKTKIVDQLQINLIQTARKNN